MNALDIYQRDAASTASTPLTDRSTDAITMALGLAGEAGEVADLVKKWHAHGHELDREKIIDEIGDILWYVAGMATVMNIDLSRVADRNRAKLLMRYPDGFSTERSINR